MTFVNHPDLPNIPILEISINIYCGTGWGHNIVLYYKIHSICNYSQTQLSIMSLIKSTHLATGFDQT